jgi:predicted SAM-dependent methyltransferase
MMRRSLKALFYRICEPAMALNAAWYRTVRASRSPGLRVHLGPGQRNYLPGWINVDANMFTGKCDVWADLRHKLPFQDATVEAMYSHHVVEHLPSLEKHFRDVFRVLQPGGVYRVAGPNGDSAARKFVDADSAWFSDFPDKRKSVGGRLENFVFCRGEHLTILTYSYLDELLQQIGYVGVAMCLPTKESHYGDLFDACLAKEWETDFSFPHTLVVEARKPTS